MAVRVVEFSNGVYEIRKIFVEESICPIFWILKIGLTKSLSSLQESEFLKLIILIFHVKKLNNCTEVCFNSFFSGGFTTAIVVNPPEKKLLKHTSVNWCELDIRVISCKF